MAIYKIYKDGEEINRINADETFTANYCKKHGCTYEVEEPEPEPEPTPEPTLEEDTAAMLIDHEFRLTLLELGITE